MKRVIPLGLILLLMGIVYLYGWDKVLNFEILRYHHAELTEFVNDNSSIAPFLFVGFLAFTIVLSAQGVFLLSILGGFLFPQPLSILYVLLGATLGATFLFLSTKLALGDILQKKSGSVFKKIEAGFNQHPGCYLLCMRLIPFFPFWFVNIAPAFFNVRLRTFLWSTIVGMAPGAFLLIQAGNGFNTIFESHRVFDIASIFNMQTKMVLLGMGILSLVPPVIKKWRKRKI